MRLDKFLKVSRLIKRRTVAKEMADKGRVIVNDHPSKASTTITVGDVLQISYGNKKLTVQVDDLRETTKKEDALTMYHIVSEEALSKEN